MIYLKWIGGILTMIVLVTVFFVAVTEYEINKEIKEARKLRKRKDVL